MRTLMLFLVTGMLFVGCDKATPTSVEQQEPQQPVEYVWRDTLLTSSWQQDDWMVAPLLDSGDLIGYDREDSAFVFSTAFSSRYGGWCNAVGGWMWNFAVDVCAFDSVAVTGVLRERLLLAQVDFTPSFTVGRSEVAGLMTIHRESARGTPVAMNVPFAFGVTPQTHSWICQSLLRFLVVAQVRTDLMEAAHATSAGFKVKIDSVEVWGFRKVPVPRE